MKVRIYEVTLHEFIQLHYTFLMLPLNNFAFFAHLNLQKKISINIL